jgi:hypothetical protein
VRYYYGFRIFLVFLAHFTDENLSRLLHGMIEVFKDKSLATKRCCHATYKRALRNFVVNGRFVFSIPVIMLVKFLADGELTRGETFPLSSIPVPTQRNVMEKKTAVAPKTKKSKIRNGALTHDCALRA